MRHNYGAKLQLFFDICKKKWILVIIFFCGIIRICENVICTNGGSGNCADAVCTNGIHSVSLAQFKKSSNFAADFFVSVRKVRDYICIFQKKVVPLHAKFEQMRK